MTTLLLHCVLMISQSHSSGVMSFYLSRAELNAVKNGLKDLCATYGYIPIIYIWSFGLPPPRMFNPIAIACVSNIGSSVQLLYSFLCSNGSKMWISFLLAKSDIPYSFLNLSLCLNIFIPMQSCAFPPMVSDRISYNEKLKIKKIL